MGLLLLALLGSSVTAKTWPRLVTVPVTPLPTVAVTTMVTVWPGCTSPNWQMPLTHSPWVAVALSKVTPGGRRSLISTECARLDRRWT